MVGGFAVAQLQFDRLPWLDKALCADDVRQAKAADRAATPMGTGVQGMSDRLAALGGTLRVTSAPGQGTQVTGRVPVARELETPSPHPGAPWAPPVLPQMRHSPPQ